MVDIIGLHCIPYTS